jgi:UDP-2-acetamido-3-amino-2,3-dideoxy-glucuronate N-acetyltransferase
MADKDDVFIHPTAVVDDGAEIGAGTKVWHFAHVCSGSRIGARCNIGQNVYIAPTVIVGEGVKIQNNVSLYDGVIVEDFAFLGPSSVFTNVSTPRSEFPRRDQYAPTLVSRGTTIGANATIVCPVTLGRYSFVAAGAVVTRDVADFALVMGAPAKRTGWVCMCGVKIVFDKEGRAVCAACGRRYVKKRDVVECEGPKEDDR